MSSSTTNSSGGLRFEGQYALVTGGANGLGYAAAARLAAEGAVVGVIDLDAGAVEQAAQRIGEGGTEAYGYACDVSDPQQVRSTVDAFAAVGGRIDVLVTMAAIYPWGGLTETTLEEWRKVLSVNLDGTFLCAQAVMPIMQRQQYGRLVTISSGTVLMGSAELPAYVTSKSGVIGLTRSLAREGGPHGVTANCLLPGMIPTENTMAMLEGQDADAMINFIVSGQCIPRPGAPEDIADAVAYLASSGAGFVTGQSLYVGGGDRFL